MSTSFSLTRSSTVLLLAGVVLLLASCGSSNNKTPSGGQPRSFQSFAAAAYKHAQCMRDHGVPAFPNPQIVNTPSEHGIRQSLPSSVAESPQFKTAQNACKGLLPEPQGGGPGAGSSEERQHTQTLLAFARCLRDHGVQGFPDPNAQDQLTLTMVRAAGVDLQAPSFLTAARACIATTHGAITLAQVEQAIHHPEAAERSGGSEAAAAAPAPK